MISIVIPAYREGEAIVDFLANLYAKHPITECVVVDASDAADVASIKTLASKRLAHQNLHYLAATHRGRAMQMNQGAALTHQPILLFLHADTCLPEDALRMIEAGIQSGERWGRFDVQFDVTRWPFRMIAAMMNWRSRMTGIATGDQAMFMTRSVFEQTGGFEQIPLMEDIALCKKLKGFGSPLCLEAKVTTAARRWQQNGVLKTILLMWWLRLAYWLGVSPTQLAKWYR